MWKTICLVLGLLLTGCLGGKDTNPLQDMLTRIQQQKELNADTIGDQATWDYLQTGLFMIPNPSKTILQKQKSRFIPKLSGLPLDSISGNFTSKDGNHELFVTATGILWGHNVEIDIVFVYTSASKLEGAVEFVLYETAIPPALYSNLPATSQSWFAGWSLFGKNKAVVATTTFTDLVGRSFAQGLTVVANVQATQAPIQQQLANLMHSDTVQATLTAQFPLATGDPLATFTAAMDTPLYFGRSSNVEASDLTLKVVVQADLSVVATLTSTVTVTDAAQTLVWNVEADVSKAQGFVMTGVLQGSWDQPLGISWLQLQNVVLKLTAEVTPQVTTQFTFTTNAIFSFLGPQSPISTDIVLGVDSGTTQFALDVQMSLPTLVQLFDAAVGTQPPNVDQVAVQGNVRFVVANYNYNGNRPGLTVSGNANIGGSGDLATAVQAVTKQALAFTFNLYSPIFTSTPQDIDFTLSETAPIQVTKGIEMDGFTVEFSIEPDPLVQLTTTLHIHVSSNPPTTLQFTPVTAKVGTDQPLTFSGEFQGDLANATFGLAWLTIKSLHVDLVFANNQVSSGTITGDVAVTFGDVTTELKVTLQGPDFEDFSFTVDVLITDMSTFLSQTMGTQPPPLTSELSAMGEITVTNFGAQPGLTLSGQAIVSPGLKLANVIKALDPNTNYKFTALVYLPIWTKNPPEVKFSIAADGQKQVTANIAIEGYDLAVEILPDPAISLTTTGNITLDHNPPLGFDLAAAISVDNAVDFTLSGNMLGTWSSPFGLPWLTVTALGTDIQFQNGVFQKLEFSGSAKFNFASSQNTVAISMVSGTSPGNVMFEARDISVSSLANAVGQVYDQSISYLDDVTTLTNTVDIIVATYHSDQFNEGLTVMDNVTITGDLLQKLKIFNGVDSAQFELGINIDVFNTVPDVKLFFKTSGFQIKPNFQFLGVTITLDIDPFSISVDTGFICTFTNNPQLEFDIEGSFSSDGTLMLAGDMLGTWDNVFGIKGFDIANVMAAIGLNPQLCGVDLCISALGLGFNITIGTEHIGFYGYAEVPDLEKILLDTSITGPNGLALSFRDVAMEWNKLVGSNSPVHINVNDIPADWGLEDLFLYIAPESGTYGGKYYERGFWFEGGFRLIGIVCDVDVKVTDSDFEFHVDLSLSQFIQMLENELQGSRSSTKVDNVTITNFSAAKIANGDLPQFTLNYELLGSSHQLNIGLGIVDLAEDFAQFFNKYLKSIFG